MKNYLEYFNDLVLINDEGESNTVPIASTSPDSGQNIRTPMLYFFSKDDCHVLLARTHLQEEMNQIVEQILTKFSPTYEKAGLNLMFIVNNLENSTPHKQVIEFRFEMEDVT